MSQAAGVVSELWRFPVKSMAGEQLQAAELSLNGIVGDRAYALIDLETGKKVSAKNSDFPNMLDCRAVFVEPPQLGRGVPPVRITLTNGKSVTSDAPDAEAALSAYFGRTVRLATVAANYFTIDHAPDLRSPEQRHGAAFLKESGITSPLPEGSFLDLFPLSVMTLSTLRRLGELQGQSRFDARRFRMNMIVETPMSGFVENGWVGQALAVGARAKVAVAMADPRCVMTTLAQGDLPKDTEVMRALTMHNRVEIPGVGRLPCAGVYAAVAKPGRLSVGDPVVLAER